MMKYFSNGDDVRIDSAYNTCWREMAVKSELAEHFDMGYEN